MAKMPTAPAGSEGTVSKDEANYRRGDPQGESCASCMNFRPEMEQCSAVQGVISPAGMCDLYSGGEEEGRTPPGEPAAPVDEMMLQQLLFGGGGQMPTGGM
jgi:hypothetical protein